MAEPQGGGHDQGSAGPRRKGTGSAASKQGGAPSPCGACKFLRRKCINGCIFAPYFGSDHGGALFAAVHKVFGASNVSKLLLHIPVNRRHKAVVTISYEAQARLSDPVYGCVSTILALQQQVETLQGELALVKTQVMNSRAAYASVFQGMQQHQQQPNINVALQPAYSNNSSASNNLVNMNCFNPGFDLAMERVPSLHTSEPLKFSRLPQNEEDEEETRIPHVFNHEIVL